MRDELEEFLDYVDVISRYKDEDIKNISDNPQLFIKSFEECSSYVNATYVKPAAIHASEDEYNAFIGPADFSKWDKSIAIKDNILIKDQTATAGSRMLLNYVATYDADVIVRLRNAGFSFAGKTNMDEFAMGFDSSTSFAGRVLNPLDTNRSAGGSSGGSAAAVASGLTRYALGSDTGGSILQPASYMGLVGFKCNDVVSRHGLISYASTLDCIGPIARSVSDAKYIFDIICDEDFKKSDSKLDNYEIWVPDNLMELCDNKEVILNASRMLGEGRVVHFDMPFVEELVASYYIVACALASSNLGRYDVDRYLDRNDGFGFEVKKRILLGNFVLSHGFYEDYFKKAYEVRQAISNVLDYICSDNRFIVMPVTRSVAPLISDLNNSLQKYTDDIFTCWTKASITMPCGNDKNGLPVGLQIVSSRADGLFELASLFEERIGGFV